MPILKFQLILLTFLILKLNQIKGNEFDYSASTVDLQKLVKEEQKILRILIEYKQKAETKLNLIKDFLQDYTSNMGDVELKKMQNIAQIAQVINEQVKNQNNNIVSGFIDQTNQADINPIEENKLIENYDSQLEQVANEVVKHPLKAYKLISRFYFKMTAIEKAFQDDKSDTEEFLENLDQVKGTIQFPQTKDLAGLITAVMRLQLTYNLDVNELAKGNLQSKIQTGSGLTAFDCFNIGLHSFQKKLYVTAIEFFIVSLKLCRENSQVLGEYIPEIESKLKEVIEKHDESLENPKAEEHDSNDMLFAHYVEKIGSLEGLESRQKYDFPHTLNNLSDFSGTSGSFVKLCQGQELRSSKEISRLKCYNYFNNGYYSISPIKMEIHSTNPPIVQFFNVFTNNQIDLLLEKAKPGIKRAKIQTLEGDISGEESSLRTSSSTWINDIQEEEIKKKYIWVGKNIEAIINLTTTENLSAEDLQIANYPPGGFYTSHFDCLHEPLLMETLSEREIEMGDRISTFMIYASDVELGGDTVFPLIGVKVKPIKGSALFWYNLYKDSTINRKQTLHAGCPVLYGEKFVMNKWIRANAQMFKRPCPKENSDESLEYDLESIGFKIR